MAPLDTLTPHLIPPGEAAGRFALANAMTAAGVAGLAPIYVCRPVLNWFEIFQHYKDQGFKTLVVPEEMHVTIAYSRASVDWRDFIPQNNLLVVASAAAQARFGKAVVLLLSSDALQDRFNEFRAFGASWDYPSYQPHVTLTYQGEAGAESVAPFRGEVLLGPEVMAKLDPPEHVAEKGSANQPRDSIGRWTIGGWGGGAGGLSGLGAKWKSMLGAATFGAASKLTKQPPMTESSAAKPFADHRPNSVEAMVAANPMALEAVDIRAPQLGIKSAIYPLHPTQPSRIIHNDAPDGEAIYVDNQPPGPGLNGVPFENWSPPGWTKTGLEGDFDEPDVPNTKGKRLGAGVIIEEPDGRIWAVEPTNHYGGYERTFPKGGIEDGLNLRQTAIKETWEESGLKVELTGHFGDFERDTSVARYYTARRVGGSPSDHHYESQSVRLIPKADLRDDLSHPRDKAIVDAILGDIPVIKGALIWADFSEDDILKAKGQGGWSKQLRVPAGAPKGGEWTTYGSGGWGGAMAALGQKLDLQKIHSDNPNHPQVLKGNQVIQVAQDWANGTIPTSPSTVGMFQKFTGYTGPNTYSQKVAASVKEAIAYRNTLTKAGQGEAPAAHVVPTVPTATSPTGGYQGTLANMMSLSDMTYHGKKPGGSADGAMYVDKQGQRWVVKSYDSPLMAQNEVAAAKLYNAIGVKTPDMRLIKLEGAHKDGIGVASRFDDTLKPMDPGNPAHVAAAQADFGAHALLANWDAIGLSYDNTMIDPSGKAVMIDPGGSLLFRAQGGAKGGLFGQKVSETTTLRDPKQNPTAAKIYGPMSASALGESYDNALMMEGVDTHAILSQYMPKGWANAVNETLQARIGNLAMQADNLQAGLASTTSLDITKTGVEMAPVLSAAALFLSDPNVAIDKNLNELMGHRVALTAAKEPGWSWYVQEIKNLTNLAMAGDAASIIDFKYEPKGKASLSGNYGTYLKAHAAALDLAAAVKAKAQDTPAKVVSSPPKPTQLPPKLAAEAAGHVAAMTYDPGVEGALYAASVPKGKAGTAEDIDFLITSVDSLKMNNTLDQLTAKAKSLTATINNAHENLASYGTEDGNALALHLSNLNDAALQGDFGWVNHSILALPPKSQGTAIAGYYETGSASALSLAMVMSAASDTSPIKASEIAGSLGNMVNGKNNVSPEQVKRAKGTKPVPDTLTADVAAQANAALANQNLGKTYPTPAAPPLTPLPPIPAVPVLSSPSNANAKMVATAAKIHDVANNGNMTAPEKIATIEALAASGFPGPPSYKKKAMGYAASVVAALGGQAAVAGAPLAGQVTASKAGLKAASDVLQSPNAHYDLSAFENDFKVTTIEQVNEFNSATLLEPPSFEGKSSKAGVNEENTATTVAMYNAAKANDLPGVMAIQPPAGKVSATGEFLSQHVNIYKASLIKTLSEVGKKTYKQVVSGNVPIGKVTSALAAVFKTRTLKTVGIEKIGLYLKLGQSPVPAKAVWDAMPEFNLHAKPTLSQKIYDDSVASAQAFQSLGAISKYTGSSYTSINHELRHGDPASQSYKTQYQLAAAINRAAVPLPEGMVLTRKMGNIGQKMLDDLKANPGAVLQEMGVGSFSYDVVNPAWSGNLFIRATVGPGVRGLYVGKPPKGTGLSSHASEREMLIPPNYRMMVVATRTGKQARADHVDLPTGYADTATVMDVILLPHNPEDFTNATD